MKMNPIKFAELIAYLSRIMVSSNSLHMEQIENICNMIDAGIDPEVVPTDKMVSRKQVGEALLQALECMSGPSPRRINAIKTIREVSDLSLVDAKSFVEALS